MVTLRIFAIAVALVLSSGRARADNKQDAKPHVTAADTYYQLGRFAEALAEYSRAYELYAAPPLLFNIGQCHRNLQNWERAIFFFEGYLAARPTANNRMFVEDLLREAQSELAKQRVVEASRKVADEKAATRRAEADEKLRLQAEQRRLEEEQQLRIDAARQNLEGARRRQAEDDRLRREREIHPVVAPPPQEPAPWYTDYVGDALVGAGLVSEVVGLLEFSAAKSDRDKADTTNNFQTYSDLIDSANSKRTISIVLDVAGAALIGGGVARFLLHDRDSEQPSVQVGPTRGGGAITWGGRF